MHVESREKSSLADPETQTLLDSLAWLRMWIPTALSPRASRRTNEGGCYQLWALHLLWLRMLSTLNSLARLRNLPLPGLKR